MSDQVPPQPLPTGIDLLRHPALNKGTAFTEEERNRLGLRGLLPPRVMTQEEQVTRIIANVRAAASDLERYVVLATLQDRNERLFYRTVMDHLAELLPILYTPTVGEACKHFSQIFRQPRGLYLSANDRGRIRAVLRNWPSAAVSVIVVTDGERILGLGDLGANGMGIPIGKLALYTACAGVDPAQCLPVALDVGTDNAALRSDPVYVGLARPRLRGPAYDALVEEFVTGVEEVFPGVLIQFEDFATENAITLLDRYRDRVCTFNDDIQGTAAVTLAGLYSATRITRRPLRDERVVFLGAGAAATGIANLIATAMGEEGLPLEEARRRISFVDSKGLVTKRRPGLQAHKLRYAIDRAPISDLLGVVETLRPSTLIGVSAVPHTFTEPVLRAMAAENERPVILALSNPTARAECTAEEAYRWTAGRAVYASGSPFPPVELDGHRYVPRQGNNAYIFPGLGLGVVLTRARRVTETMFAAAAQTLATQVTEEDLAQGSIYPPIERIWEVSARIAVAVAEVAYREDLATVPRPSDLPAFVRANRYDPNYPTYA
jgi:malate dehydrogenase (oxaloacetate-decarboxylating)(NADP+)